MHIIQTNLGPGLRRGRDEVRLQFNLRAGSARFTGELLPRRRQRRHNPNLTSPETDAQTRG